MCLESGSPIKNAYTQYTYYAYKRRIIKIKYTQTFIYYIFAQIEYRASTTNKIDDMHANKVKTENLFKFVYIFMVI